MKNELLYISDTYCIWCYGFSQAIAKLAHEYKDQVKISVINAGMIPTEISLSAMFGRFPDPIALHQRVTDMSGAKFANAYLDEIKHHNKSKRILNSTIPAKAFLTFKHLGVSDELAIADAIQKAYYLDNNDLQELETYREVAKRFDIDFVEFKEQFTSNPAIARGVVAENDWVKQAGIQGYPALIMRESENQFLAVSNGFLPYAQLKTNLDRTLQHLKQIQTQGETCAIAPNS